jgi:SAM-dependent methyltransferase
MTVFASPYANQYDALYDAKDYVAECDLIAAAAARHGVPINRVLDIGCGTGEHSLEWASRGISSVGVDLSPEMIEIAQRKAAALASAVQPEWHVGDARNFEVGGSYDVATMMFAVLGYMNSNEDVLAALKNVRRHLQPGGLFVFDIWYGPAVLSVRPEDRVRVVNSASTQIIRAASTKIDSFRHLAHVTFKLWTLADARYLGYTEETHAMRYFFPQEMKLLLETAGFDVASIRSFPSGEAVGENTWNAYCEAIAV